MACTPAQKTEEEQNQKLRKGRRRRTYPIRSVLGLWREKLVVWRLGGPAYGRRGRRSSGSVGVAKGLVAEQVERENSSETVPHDGYLGRK